MVITYHGDNFFRVESGNFTLVVDPTSDRMKPDLSLKTLASPETPEGSFQDNLIDSAGEFDISGVSVKGIQVQKESAEKFIKVVFSVSGLDDIRLAFLGHVSELPDSDIIERLGAVDILFLPVGHPPFLSVPDALKAAKLIEPKIIIPSFSDKKIADIFMKEFGEHSSQEDKLVLKAKDLPEKGMKAVILKNE